MLNNTGEINSRISPDQDSEEDILNMELIKKYINNTN